MLPPPSASPSDASAGSTGTGGGPVRTALLLLLLGGGVAMLWRRRKQIVPLVLPNNAADRGRADRMSRTQEMMAVWMSFRAGIKGGSPSSPSSQRGERSRTRSSRLPSTDEDDVGVDMVDDAGVAGSGEGGQWL